MRSLVHTGDALNIAFYAGARQATLRAEGRTMTLLMDREWPCDRSECTGPKGSGCHQQSSVRRHIARLNCWVN